MPADLTVVAPFAFCAVLAAALGYAWRAYRQDYLAYWAGFWALYLPVWALVVWLEERGGARAGVGPAAMAAAAALAWMARFSAALGTAAYLGRTVGRRHLAWVGAFAVGLAAAGALARGLAAHGALPRGAADALHTYYLGGLLFAAVSIWCFGYGDRRPAPGRSPVLGVAFAAATASDLFDVATDLWPALAAISDQGRLQLSILVTLLCDTVFGAGMLVAAIGAERGRAERVLSELRATEARTRHAQRLETVGQLAGGVAHDFNNLLTGVLANLSFVRERLPPDDPGQEDLRDARRAAERAAQLTRQLLTFARRHAVEPRLLDMNDVVGSLEGLLASVLGERVEVRFLPCPAPASVLADLTQLEQLLVNLAVNARDAMPQGGTFTIETALVRGPTMGGAPAHPDDPPPGHWVRLAVEDSGMGMEPATLDRIFEPFFTTKGPGRGTGLGLATVHGIVEQAGGCIRVRSAPGRGTRFSVYLPRRAEGAPPLQSTPRPAESLGRGESILLVEDDALVRAIASRTLSGLGYRVVVAPDGRSALSAWDGGLGEVDLLVTDVVMPGMDGPELVRTLRHRKPGLRVLFTSGYTRTLLGGEGAHFVPKPFTPAELAARVREALDAPFAPGRETRPPTPAPHLRTS